MSDHQAKKNNVGGEVLCEVLMSRIAKNPIKISKGVECNFNEGIFSAKGKLGQITIHVNPNYKIIINDQEVMVLPKKKTLMILIGAQHDR